MKTAFATFFVVMALSICSGFAQDIETSYLVLKNYQLMEGKIEKTESGYRLKSGQSTSVLPESKVWFKAETRNAAYWQLASRTKASDINAQIKVLQFCLRYELFQEAQNQIDILQLLPLKATRLEQLHRQVHLAHQRAKTRAANRSRLAQNAVEQIMRDLPSMRDLPPMKRIPKKINGAGLAKGAPSLGDSKVAQVTFDQPIPTRRTPTDRELDELTDSLPKNAVAMFKRKIEPLMARSCFAAGCHNSETKMPVMRLSEMRVMPRRMSQRNMHSALSYADPYSPLQSEFLKMAATPHGGSKTAPVELRSEPFNRMAQWLIAASSAPLQLHKMPQWMLTEQEIAAMEAQAEWEAIQLAKLAEESIQGEDSEPDFDPQEFAGLPAALRLTDPTDNRVAYPGPPKTVQTDATKEKVKENKNLLDPNEFNRKFGKNSPADKK